MDIKDDRKKPSVEKKNVLASIESLKAWNVGLESDFICHLKISYIQNKFMRSWFLPKCKPKITRISALANKPGS